MTDKRLNLIKERVENLEKIKKEGINLSKRYKLKEIVYYPEQSQYGRIVIDTEEFIAVDFNPQIVYFRRKDEWTEDQLKFLRENYKKLSNQTLSEYIGFMKEKIEEQLSKENLKRRFVWTTEKDDFLLKSKDISNQEIAEKLNTTIASVKGRLRRLRANGINIKFRKRCFTWTKSKDEILIKNQGKTIAELADMLNTSESLIEERFAILKEKTLISKKKKK
jgi:predicted transcriptional regulator